ncbi:hypothetical protein RDABS01_031033, partial [Bienertia sinuspersici]
WIGTKIVEIKKLVRVKFLLEKEYCEFEAIPLNWSEGHVWSLLLELPIENSIQYKFLLKRGTGEVLWQPGPDRKAQKISEQEQLTEENAKLECKSLVESSVLK